MIVGLTLLHPEMLLLGLLAAGLLRRRYWSRPTILVLRLLILAALLLVIAGPERSGQEEGRDLILVLDRSQSMPVDTLETAREMSRSLIEDKRATDRIGLLTFGREPRIESVQDRGWRWNDPVKDIDDDATDLAQALDRAQDMIPPGKPGSILLFTDGEYTGPDPIAAAWRARRRGLRIDVMPAQGRGLFDTAIEELSLPGEVAILEPFRFSAWIRAGREDKITFRLRRNGKDFASGSMDVSRGLNRLVFRDRLTETGLVEYSLEIQSQQDQVPENNRARGVLRASGGFRVLCLTPEGREDRLTRSLRASGIDLAVADPRTTALPLGLLTGFRAVILEDIPAEDLRPGSLTSLARYVRHLGGGLLMTGGQASFGRGGYHRSVVEEVLPVTMEIRKEQRRYSVAMCIALDRSGSMARPIASGQTKMDMANLGTMAALELLGPQDSISVLAVDSAPHVIVEQQQIEDLPALITKVGRIESMGGGIYVHEALLAAAEQIRKAPQGSKHILLFSDAADSEKPEDSDKLVSLLHRGGVTLSVIALGKDTDKDAALLQRLSKLGGGRCTFVDDATQLERAFATETIQMARSSTVEEATRVTPLPSLLALGGLGKLEYPEIGGYSIAYARPRAEVALTSVDDQKAPILSFWQHGLGRSAAFLGEVDGKLSGGLATWPGYGDFVATLVRWIAGSEARDEVFAEVRREGHEGVIDIEVDRKNPGLLGELDARLLDARGEESHLLLRRIDELRVQARFALSRSGHYLPSLQVGKDRFLRLAPIALPYSPEFEPRSDPGAALRTLEELASLTGGQLVPSSEQVLSGTREGQGRQDLALPILLLALLLLLTEIAVRRLDLVIPAPVVAAVQDLPSRTRRWLRRKPRTKVAPRRDEVDTSGPASAKEAAPESAKERGGAVESAGPSTDEPAGHPEQDIASLLDRMKRRRR